MTAESKRLGQKVRRQPPLPVVHAHIHYLRLQPPLPVVTASVACGCSLHDLRLQVHQLFNGGNYREALQVPLLTTTCNLSYSYHGQTYYGAAGGAAYYDLLLTAYRSLLTPCYLLLATHGRWLRSRWTSSRTPTAPTTTSTPRP